jgi:pimeloyl-ACP methyl ester carboxylesterase
MNNYLSVFRSKSGEKQVLEAYDSIMDLWPVPYEDLFLNTCLGRTHVIASGPKTAPPIILIHAFYASAATWFQNVGSLSKCYRVYAVDIIGDPNKSQPIKPIRQLSDFVDWFNDVMNKLHLDQADFIGNSVGAFHSMNFALHVPQRVRRMILIGPAATFLKITPFYFHTFPGGITGWTFLVKHAIRWIENEASLEPMFHKLFYLIMKYGKSANQVFPAIFTDEQLKRIATPTLLIYGEKEVIYDYRLAIKRAEKCMQNIKTEIIPRGNHLTAVSQPDLTGSAILNFLNKSW